MKYSSQCRKNWLSELHQCENEQVCILGWTHVGYESSICLTQYYQAVSEVRVPLDIMILTPTYYISAVLCVCVHACVRTWTATFTAMYLAVLETYLCEIRKKKEFILNSISRSSSVWVIAGCHTRAGEEVCKKNTQVHMHREDKSVTHSFVAPLLKKNTHTQQKLSGIIRWCLEGNCGVLQSVRRYWAWVIHVKSHHHSHSFIICNVKWGVDTYLHAEVENTAKQSTGRSETAPYELQEPTDNWLTNICITLLSSVRRLNQFHSARHSGALWRLNTTLF